MRNVKSRTIFIKVRMFYLVILFGSSTQDCPEGDRAHNGSCYSFRANLTTFDEAKNICDESGYWLATINSNEELNFVKQYVKNEFTWIGAYRNSSDDKWKWANGEPWFDNVKWTTSVSTSSKCSIICSNHQSLHAWSCNKKQPFLCEQDYKPVTVTEMTTSVEPDAGHCQITPKEGTSLIDKYKVDCNQWEPWGQRSFCTNKDTDELVYELRTINTNSSDLIYKHKKSSFPLLWLPSGDKESSYNLNLVVYISDECGQIGRFALNATVYSADTSKADLEWTNSLVEDVLNLNDTAEAMGALSIVARSVGSTPEAKAALVNALSNLYSNEEDQSLDILEPASQILRDITSRDASVELTLDTKGTVASMVGDTVKSLSLTNTNITDINIRSTQKVISNIFTASSSIFGSLIAGTSHEESNKDKEKTILASLSKAADVALDVALLTLDSEEEGSFTLVTEFIEATVEKRNSSSLKNKQLTSKFGGFTLPGCEQENGTRVRFVKFLSSMVNTHLFESPDVLQGSPVVSLEINDEDGVPSPLDGIYTINIAKTDVMAARNNMTARASKLNISETAPLEFSFNIIQPGSVVSMTLESTDSSALYGVYIQEGLMANETMHDCGWKIPGKPAQTVTYNATNIGTYYVMVKLERHGTHSDVNGILIYVSVNICRFWDDTEGEWKTEGCWPDKSDNAAVLTCKCDHLPSVKPTN